MLLTRYITVSPDKIDGDLQDTLLLQLKTLVNTCSKKDGYIFDVYDVVSISNNFIAYTGDITFTVQFNARVLKPTVGQELECTVSKIFPQGIFVEHNAFLILIPITNLKKYKYNSTDNVFTMGGKNIEVGTMVAAVIKNIRYEKHKFTGIGDLKEDD